MAANSGYSTAPELDPKYDDFIGQFPTVAPISDPADEKKGYPGHVDEAQKAQLFQLRSMLEAEGYTQRLDTLTMLRFLRARKFDVNLAKQMFVEYEDWRKKTLLDALVPTWNYQEGEAMAQYYPQFYHKTDKDGRPVYIEKLGNIDLAAMRKITTDQRMLDNLAVEYEYCAGSRFPASSRATGNLVETCCTIMDMKGVSITKAGQVYTYVNQASVISQNYYPERLGKLYIINAPWGFSTVWSVVKGWLDPVTVKKINILGGSYQKELLKQIPAENLPEAYGGSCACEGGCHKSNAGPWKVEEELLEEKKGKGELKQEDLPWFKREAVIAQAYEALKGTDKDPALQNQGGQTVGAAGQETAAIAS